MISLKNFVPETQIRENSLYTMSITLIWKLHKGKMGMNIDKYYLRKVKWFYD